jgi:hypothetical protein
MTKSSIRPALACAVSRLVWPGWFSPTSPSIRSRHCGASLPIKPRPPELFQRFLVHLFQAVPFHLTLELLPPRRWVLLDPVLAQGLGEVVPVHVIQEDVLTLVPAAHHVVNRSGVLDAQLASHRVLSHTAADV